jgi:hypothetical protein
MGTGFLLRKRHLTPLTPLYKRGVAFNLIKIYALGGQTIIERWVTFSSDAVSSLFLPDVPRNRRLIFT